MKISQNSRRAFSQPVRFEIFHGADDDSQGNGWSLHHQRHFSIRYVCFCQGLHDGTSTSNPAAFGASRWAGYNQTLATMVRYPCQCDLTGRCFQEPPEPFIKGITQTPLASMACEDDFHGAIACSGWHVGGVSGHNLLIY